MPTVEDWLNGLGLGKYAEAFTANDVDLRALPHLDGADLQELGVSLGHRKVMLAAIAELRGFEPEEIKAEQRAPAVKAALDPRGAEATGEAGPDVRLLSVLFCDMVGSTGLSGRFNAEEMHDLISSYQDTVASAVTRFGGYVAKFFGDGVLAYFGWPMAYEDHAERAIRAGLAAVGGVELLRTPSGDPLQARVGVATGRVVSATLPAAGCWTAVRWRRLAGHAFEFDDLGARKLKGFDGNVPMFLVRGEREVESRFDAAHGDALSQFVGRNSEIGMLLERWELAKGGQGQAIFVIGEAGIGKSRLVEALVERLQVEPHQPTRRRDHRSQWPDRPNHVRLAIDRTLHLASASAYGPLESESEAFCRSEAFASFANVRCWRISAVTAASEYVFFGSDSLSVAPRKRVPFCSERGSIGGQYRIKQN